MVLNREIMFEAVRQNKDYLNWQQQNCLIHMNILRQNLQTSSWSWTTSSSLSPNCISPLRLVAVQQDTFSLGTKKRKRMRKAECSAIEPISRRHVYSFGYVRNSHTWPPLPLCGQIQWVHPWPQRPDQDVMWSELIKDYPRCILS